MLLHTSPNARRELSRGKLGGIDLLDRELAAVDHRLDIDSEPLRALGQQSQFFVEDEHGRLFAAFDRTSDKGESQQRLAGPCRSQDQHARPALQTAAKQSVQL